MEDIKELLYKIRRFIDEDEILKKEKVSVEKTLMFLR